MLRTDSCIGKHSRIYVLFFFGFLLLSCGDKKQSQSFEESTNGDSIVYVSHETSSWVKTTCRGVVKSVSDGDTYNILIDGETMPRRVRMVAIDAPEKGQDFSRRSRQYLDSMIWRKSVTLYVREIDSYGRLLAFTYLPDGREMSQEMLKAGMAWHYRHYDNEAIYDSLEQSARIKKLGLWALDHPVEPWIEKAMRKKGYTSAEIRQMKRDGSIDDMKAVNRIAVKDK